MSTIGQARRAAAVLFEHPWHAPHRWRMSAAVAAAERQAILALGDVVVLNAALVLTSFCVPAIAPWIPSRLQPLEVIWSVSLSVVWLVTAAAVGCFTLRLVWHPSTLVPRITVATLLVCVIYFFIPRLSAPITQARALMLFFSGTTLVALVAWRLLSTFFLWHPVLQRRVCILGVNQATRELADALRAQPDAGFSFLGFVTVNEPPDQELPDSHPTHLRKAGETVHLLPSGGREEGLVVNARSPIGAANGQFSEATSPGDAEEFGVGEVLGGSGSLLEIVRARQVDDLVLGTWGRLTPEMERALVAAYEAGVRVTPLSTLYELLTGRVPVTHVGSHWLIALPRVAPGLTYTCVKRAVDIGVAGVGLLATAVLLAVVACANWFDPPGSIFYRQERIGRLGRPFQVVKVRTMRDAGSQGSEGRAEVTRLGGLLRSCRLDELPQCWNILKGDMSLVGPRPFVRWEVEEFSRHIPFFRARLLVRPGLTGWAQINHGYSNSIANASVKLQYDLYYLKYQSLYLDLIIALRTVGVMLRFKGS
jgi:lipopolysaccharide/colanic/teichoic acid biosynthesis glycosyltransferase